MNNMFIRTKDGIYETSQTISVDFKECYIEAYDTQLERWVKKDIIAQADTIEELCDSFVYLDISFNRIVHRREDTLSCLCERHNIINDTEMPYNQFKHFEEDEDFIQLDATHWLDKEKVDRGVYGCIWTDKGLIYVAKMNDEGKLCLI